MSNVNIIKAGQRTSLQDQGRQGHAHQGFTCGGAADFYAYFWGNYILGNNVNQTSIEIFLGQLKVRITKDSVLSLTGANCSAQLDDKPIRNWSRFCAKKGQSLTFSTPINGLITYLSIQGGFNSPKTLGSASTVFREGIGGIRKNGSPLLHGDRLSAKPSIVYTLPIGTEVSPRFYSAPFYSGIKAPSTPTKVRVIQGYQHAGFPSQSLETFYSSLYTITPEANSMGYQMAGQTIETESKGIVSEAIATGSIQIPPSGQPIVMLSEKQTIGGYPKLGVVAKMDICKLAQLRPGQQVLFVAVSRQKSKTEYLNWRRFFGY